MPLDSEYIKPDDGLWIICEPAGSMFDIHYVYGGVIALGAKVGNKFF